MKTKIKSRLVIAILLFSMIAMYGAVPQARAASLTNVKDTLSTSAPGINANNAVSFTTAVPLVNTDRVDVRFPAEFGALNAGNMTCPGGSVASVVGSTARCTIGGGGLATGAWSINASSTNPAAVGSYQIEVLTTDASGQAIEKSSVRVYIIEQVTITATVPPALNFQILGLATSTDVNGVLTTGSSSATTINFNTLTPVTVSTPTASSTMGQQLLVTTNATVGFIVTVQQNQELTSAGGDNINSFSNNPTNFGSTTPAAWINPLTLLDQYQTYGHMGLTSDDSTLNWGGGDPYSSALYSGLAAALPTTVMYHDGPADGLTQNKGLANVAYHIMISALQEAGDYTNTLTYICTPTY